MRQTNQHAPTNGDRDLETRVTNYLVAHRMPALRKIEVEARAGTVVLRGRVDSFYQKQLCLNCTRRVAGVIKLEEEVRVGREAVAMA